MASITPCKVQMWNKTNLTIFLVITCGVLIPSHIARFSDDSTPKTKHHEVAKRLDPSHQLGENDTSSVSSGKSSTYNIPNNLTAAANATLPQPLLGSSDPNGGLLTDPSHPTFGTIPVGVPIIKPSDLVTSALLTAAPSSATAKANSSMNSESSKNMTNQPQGYNQTLGQQPVLSGSMAISLPTLTTTSMVSQATQPPVPANGAVSLSSLSPNTVLEVVTAPTPTTSTAYVYATNSPISSDNASPSSNSSGHYLLPSAIYPLVGFTLALIPAIQINCL
ncbi:hypothetical protein PTTG_06850 [Puccinia triticina 1-1 BBBD Race 1]|uniref:Uncharacterized protein n=2 Tax=Puccinia triticina TaxID=208348 RepID=A0A0C4F180_PUCT1|nr:uncharacterized protein PtA15_10A44 [Puccinia triticina]OAV99221.1 hypothetical protein PTTG_06850 [Puccinia triticina 1-1 BBBD Race 1]WAQ88625.1 hypothetical protein PtA15_10A44 [Puccinia triticina]WAR58702.1 hypothetical protein PtB15_10B40 [Puccinia triticina]